MSQIDTVRDLFEDIHNSTLGNTNYYSIKIKYHDEHNDGAKTSAFFENRHYPFWDQLWELISKVSYELITYEFQYICHKSPRNDVIMSSFWSCDYIGDKFSEPFIEWLSLMAKLSTGGRLIKNANTQ